MDYGFNWVILLLEICLLNIYEKSGAREETCGKNIRTLLFCIQKLNEPIGSYIAVILFKLFPSNVEAARNLRVPQAQHRRNSNRASAGSFRSFRLIIYQ